MKFFFSLCMLLAGLAGSATAVGQTTHSDSISQHRYEKKRYLIEKGPLAPEDTAHLYYYPTDNSYRVVARLEFLHNEQPFRLPTSDGTSKEYIRYAKAHFRIGKQDGTLTLFRSTDLVLNPAYRDHLFLPFTDQTSGDETYGSGRYIDLSVADISGDRITIDFNKAYNPYCAYSSGYRCPIPPAENMLLIPVRAGEKFYRGATKDRPAEAPPPWEAEERRLILHGDTSIALPVIQTTDPDQLLVLKRISTDVLPGDTLLPILAKRMFLAMRDPQRPGVGIAAPQVGINRNVIWVQRFDKTGEPFEFYINPKITWRSGLLRKGREGCLSIPDTMGQVLRHYAIRLSYDDPQGNRREEIIEGFTAVIFQHETDHLYGILFTDRLDEQAGEDYEPVNEQEVFYRRKFPLSLPPK